MASASPAPCSRRSPSSLAVSPPRSGLGACGDGYDSNPRRARSLSPGREERLRLETARADGLVGTGRRGCHLVVRPLARAPFRLAREATRATTDLAWSRADVDGAGGPRH